MEYNQIEKKLNEIYIRLAQIETNTAGAYEEAKKHNSRLSKAENRIEDLEKSDIRFEGKLDALALAESQHIERTNKYNSRVWDFIIRYILPTTTGILAFLLGMFVDKM